MKKIISILSIIFFTFSLVGCIEAKTELNNLSVVLADGFDLTKDNKYLLTVQVLSTQKNSSSSMGGQSKGGQQISSDIIVYSVEGETPTDAISKLSIKFGNELFFGHSKYMVIGKDLAQAKLDLLVDAMLRGHDTRLDNVLLVTKGKASDIVKNCYKR